MRENGFVGKLAGDAGEAQRTHATSAGGGDAISRCGVIVVTVEMTPVVGVSMPNISVRATS